MLSWIKELSEWEEAHPSIDQNGAQYMTLKDSMKKVNTFLNDSRQRVEDARDRHCNLLPLQSHEPATSTVWPLQSFRPYPEGLHLKLPHLKCDTLIGKLHKMVPNNNIVFVFAPEGTGKTSLLMLFDYYCGVSCVWI